MAVFPDGRVAVVRADGYRVDWILPNGSRQSSAPIRYTPIRMTDADRREEEALRQRARANQMTMTTTMNAGAGGTAGTQRAASVGGGSNTPLPPLTDWPDVKPPFRSSGMASVWARPNGEFWVRRTEAAGATGTLYQVIDALGVVTHQVRLGKGLTLVGFGNGTIYTTRLDEDDLVYLQRHAVP